MSVRQVSEYLQINEKKVYALASEGTLPGTKITGKWLFPRVLVDQWLLESSHGGVLTDRLVIAGGDDPLLQRVVAHAVRDLQARALVTYTATGTRLGLSLLALGRADACALHWGPAEESAHRHPALLTHHPQHRRWVLVRLYQREQGLLISPRLGEVRGLAALAAPAAGLRWALREEGSATQRFLDEAAIRQDVDPGRITPVARASSEREAATLVAGGAADLAPGVRGTAAEFGLRFLPLGWEAFDLALFRGVYFRALLRRLLEELDGERTRSLAGTLGGYRLEELGRIVWSAGD